MCIRSWCTYVHPLTCHASCSTVLVEHVFLLGASWTSSDQVHVWYRTGTVTRLRKSPKDPITRVRRFPKSSRTAREQFAKHLLANRCSQNIHNPWLDSQVRELLASSSRTQRTSTYFNVFIYILRIQLHSMLIRYTFVYPDL